MRATAGIGRRRRRPCADLLDELVAVFDRHADVAEQNIRSEAFQFFQRLVGGRSESHFGVLTGEEAADDVASIGLVVDDQDFDAGKVGDLVKRLDELRLGLRVDPIGLGRLDGLERQGDGECRAVIFAGAFGGDGAAVELDELLDDGQAEAEAAVAAGRSTVGLAEAIEDVRQEFGRDAGPVSVTLTSTCELTRSSAIWMRPPLGVNLTALVSRFQTTCCSGRDRRGPGRSEDRGLAADECFWRRRRDEW